MEWAAGLSAAALLAACCGLKALALWLANRAGRAQAEQTPEEDLNPVGSGRERLRDRSDCPWC